MSARPAKHHSEELITLVTQKDVAIFIDDDDFPSALPISNERLSIECMFFTTYAKEGQ